MRYSKRVVVALAVVSVMALAGSAALAAGEIIHGEKLDPSTYGPGIVETMEQALARDRAAPPGKPGERVPEQGTWVVPSIRATYYPHSGRHNLVNKWAILVWASGSAR